MQKEETVIQRIVRYSNEILTLKLFRDQLEKTETIKNLSSLKLHECDMCFPEMFKEIDSRLLQLRLDIERLLIPLLEGKRMYVVPKKLSTEELTSGYIVFAEADTTGKLLLIEDKPVEWVLPLSDFKDSVRTIKAGVLIPKKKNESILGNLDSVIKPAIKGYNNVIKKRIK